MITRTIATQNEAWAAQGKPTFEPPRTAVVLASGLLAGAAAAVVSQPFDLLLTRICGSTGVSSLVECVLPGAGFRNQLGYLIGLGPAAFTGLAPRLAMISVMTSCQFFLYDALRDSLNCQPPPQLKPLLQTGEGAAGSSKR